MFEEMTEQFQKSLNPVNEMIGNNAKLMVKLAQQQTKLFTDVVNESVTYTKNLSEQTDLLSVFNVQKAFVENVWDKMVSASEDTNKLFSEVQETAGETMKPFFQPRKSAADSPPNKDKVKE